MAASNSSGTFYDPCSSSIKMVKILSQTETRVKVARKRKSLRCLTSYGAQLQRTSHDRGRSGVMSLPALPAESERAEEPLCPTQKGVTPRQRVKEFPTEPFTVSHGQLFYSACREQLSLKRSILKNHVESLKHRNWNSL